MQESQKFICACQKKPIPSPKLRRHIYLKRNHTIKPLSTDKKAELNKNFISESKINLDNSIKIQFNETYNHFTNFIPKFIKTLLNLSTSLKFLESFFPNEQLNPNSALTSLDPKTSKLTTLKIQKELQKFPIKEITFFKSYKQKFKTGFTNFLKKSCRGIKHIICFDNFLITSGLDGIIRLWNANTLELVKIRFFHKAYVACLDIDSSSKYLLSGSADKKICLWDTNSLKLHKYFIEDSIGSASIKFLLGNRIFASISFESELKVWDIFKNQLIMIIQFQGNSQFIMNLKNFNSEIDFCCDNQILKFNMRAKRIILRYSQIYKFTYAVYANEERKIITGDDEGLFCLLIQIVFELLTLLKL